MKNGNIASLLSLTYCPARESLPGSAATGLTCNHEQDSSDHSCNGFALRLVIHKACALHSHGGDQQRHRGEEDAEQHHSPGSLDLSWRSRSGSVGTYAVNFSLIQSEVAGHDLCLWVFL